MDKICSEKQILNKETKRCVNKNGMIGKKILIKNEKIHLFWKKNSCYIDSILVALFHNKNLLKFPMKKYNNKKLNYLVHSINNELIKLFNIISTRNENNEKHCSLLRKLISTFYNELKLKIINSNENWIDSQLDVFDFLDLCEYIYDIKNNLKFKERTNLNFTNFIFNIPIDYLLNKKKVFIKKIFPSYDNITLLKADNLFLKIFRNLDTFKLETKIIPANKLKLPENSFFLYLNSIIIHYGNNKSGHYICLYKYYNKWFEYDDLQQKSTYIGSLNKIIQNDNYISNITALVYSK
jgi:hypothetical protein